MINLLFYICAMQKLSVKERIIETASRLFYFEGYNQTGINQIIEEAGVAKSSMYKSFRSKEEIAVVYLQRRHGVWMGKLEDFVSEGKHGKDKIEMTFDYLHDWLEEVNFVGCGFQNIITDLPKGQERIADQVRLHKNELLQWILNMLKEDPLYIEKSETLANEIMVLIEGAIIFSQIQNNPSPILSAKTAALKLME